MAKDNNFLIYAVVFLLVFGPYLFLSFFLNKPKMQFRNLESRNLPPFFQRLWGILSCFTETLGKLSKKLQPRRAEKLRNKLLVANIKMDVEYIFAAEILTGMGATVLGILFTLMISSNGGIVIGAGVLFGFIGLVYPSMTIEKLADERQTKIMRTLPFAIDLIASAMRSGVDFSAAIRYYVSTESSSSPLSFEFGIMLRQIELGKSRTQALDEMSGRIQHDAFTAFADAVIHGIEIGASIVETMKIQAEEMRRVRFNIAERKAARAVSAMIFPIAVFIMPAMFIIIGVPVLLKVMGSGLGGVM